MQFPFDLQRIYRTEVLLSTWSDREAESARILRPNAYMVHLIDRALHGAKHASKLCTKGFRASVRRLTPATSISSSRS